MKRILVILLLLSLGLTQELIPVVEESYEDGMPKTVKYYESISDKLELSIVKKYYENGQIKQERNWKNGEWNGKYSSYHNNGQIKDKGNYKDGKEDGKWMIYLGENDYYDEPRHYKNFNYIGDAVSIEGNYNNGKEDGIWVSYYENGQIGSQRNYKNGKLDGKYTDYHENGQISYEGNIKDGKTEGKVILYYENGQIRLEGNYKDGERRNGKWMYYNEDGTIDSVKNYIDGKSPDEDYEEFDSGFEDSDEWDAPPPPDEDGDSEFVAYDNAPTLKAGRGINPEYPKLAMEMRLEGKVYIKFFIDKRGRVNPSSVKMVRGNPVFEKAAIDAVANSEWWPAMQRDMKVGVWRTVGVKFNLKDAND